MPIILLALEFIKKYWVYFALGFIVLIITVYATHIFHQAHMYKQEKVIVSQQQKTISDYGTVLQKQKDYSIDLQSYQKDLISKTIQQQTQSVSQKEQFHNIINGTDSKPKNVVAKDVTDGFNNLFDGFNNEK